MDFPLFPSLECGDRGTHVAASSWDSAGRNGNFLVFAPHSLTRTRAWNPGWLLTPLLAEGHPSGTPSPSASVWKSPFERKEHFRQVPRTSSFRIADKTNSDTLLEPLDAETTEFDQASVSLQANVPPSAPVRRIRRR